MTSTDWVGAGKIVGAHSGAYRLMGCLVKGAGSIRVRWGDVVGGRTLNLEQQSDNAIYRDLDLGPIDVVAENAGTWEAAIETTGTVSLAGIVLVPMATWVTAVTPPGASGLGTLVLQDPLGGSGALHNSNVDPVPGSSSTKWATDGTWTRRAGGYVERTAVSEGSVRRALAGSTDYSGVKVQAQVAWDKPGGSALGAAPHLWTMSGVIARYSSSGSGRWLFAGFAARPQILTMPRQLVVMLCEAGSAKVLAMSDETFGEGFIPLPDRLTLLAVSLTVDTQGRWQVHLADRLALSGQDPRLAAGGALATGKVGLLDQWRNVSAGTRRFAGFSVHGSADAQVPLLPAGKTLELTPAGMVTLDGGDRRRISHRGGVFAPPPGVPSRLVVMSRRFAGVAATEAAGKTDGQKVTVMARPRWRQVP